MGRTGNGAPSDPYIADMVSNTSDTLSPCGYTMGPSQPLHSALRELQRWQSHNEQRPRFGNSRPGHHPRSWMQATANSLHGNRRHQMRPRKIAFSFDWRVRLV